MSFKPQYFKNFWTDFFNSTRPNYGLFVTCIGNLARLQSAVSKIWRRKKSGEVFRPPPQASRGLTIFLLDALALELEELDQCKQKR